MPPYMLSSLLSDFHHLLSFCFCSDIFSFSEIHPRTPWGSGPYNRILSRMLKCNQQPPLYHQSFTPFVICRNKKWWLYSAWEICLLLWWAAETELSLVICCQWRMKTCKVRHVQGHLWTLAASGRLSHSVVQKDPTYKRSSLYFIIRLQKCCKDIHQVVC